MLEAAAVRSAPLAAARYRAVALGYVLTRSRLAYYSPGCQLSAGTSDFVTIWDLLVISASASADPYIFRVISYQCPAQCLLFNST